MEPNWFHMLIHDTIVLVVIYQSYIQQNAVDCIFLLVIWDPRSPSLPKMASTSYLDCNYPLLMYVWLGLYVRDVHFLHSGIEEATACTGKKVCELWYNYSWWWWFDQCASEKNNCGILCPCKCDKIIVESRTVSANVVRYMETCLWFNDGMFHCEWTIAHTYVLNEVYTQ